MMHYDKEDDLDYLDIVGKGDTGPCVVFQVRTNKGSWAIVFGDLLNYLDS